MVGNVERMKHFYIVVREIWPFQMKISRRKINLIIMRIKYKGIYHMNEKLQQLLRSKGAFELLIYNMVVLFLGCRLGSNGKSKGK